MDTSMFLAGVIVGLAARDLWRQFVLQRKR